MDGFSIALGIIAALTGIYGLYFASTGRLALQSPVTKFLFAVRGTEPTRPHTALSSGALVVFGIYCILSGAYPRIPLWPSVVALLVVCALQLAAHLQRDDA
jgi:uncharacterized membrane protein YagU involved in acid resistance